MNKLILTAIVTLFMSQTALAKDLLCNYDGSTTEVTYNYGNSPIDKVLVAPNIQAHTEGCEGSACYLIFESFGAEREEYDFNKVETIDYTSPDGLTITCRDAAKVKTQKEVNRVVDQTERAVDKAIDDVEDFGKEIDRGVRSLFD